MILFPYRAVPSGHQISMVIANILEETAPHRFHGGNRTQTIREWNDALQGRSDLSLDMLYERLEQTCGGGGAKRIEEIKETMAAFRHQKMLRTLRYTMTGSQTYDYQLWDLDPSCPLKIIDQEIFDHAAEHGFPAFTTSLLASPYQNHDGIIRLGQEFSEQYGVEFLYRDFRPNFREGNRRARELGFYMQKYCGCIFSEADRYRKQIERDQEKFAE